MKSRLGASVDFPKQWVKNTNELKYIRNSEDLIKEGELMGHCVSSYVSACLRGTTQIYHYGEEAPGGVTVEVAKKDDGEIIIHQIQTFGNGGGDEYREEVKRVFRS